jgi:hypothetical protein
VRVASGLARFRQMRECHKALSSFFYPIRVPAEFLRIEEEFKK